jgi:hypothetical protein
LAFVGTIGVGVAWAQPAGVTIITPVSSGDCAVAVQFASAPAAGDVVELRLNAPTPFASVAANGRSTVPFKLKGPLAAGDELTARSRNGSAVGAWSAPVTATAGTGAPECTVATPPDPDIDDERHAFEVTAYLGRGYDNFAPGSVANYAPGTKSSESWRYVAGVDFQFRLWGKRGDDRQFWLSGESLHGVRSADIDCTPIPGENLPALCAQTKGQETERFLETLEHASSLEAYLTPRLELFTLQRGSGFATKFYVTGRFGVMVLEDAPEAFRAHHIGAGLMNSVGPFTGSYLEVGWGKTELFLPATGEPRWNRLKLDALVSFPVFGMFLERAKDWKRAPRMFIQLYSDFDPADGAADSLQTFVGLDFDLSGALR